MNSKFIEHLIQDMEAEEKEKGSSSPAIQNKTLLENHPIAKSKEAKN
jgi:hypothetical protein